MFEIRQYKKGDENFEPIEKILKGHPGYKKYWDIIVKSRWTWTGLCDGNVLGVGGIIPQENDNAIVWIILNKQSLKMKKSLIRILHQAIRLAKSFRFKELCAYVQDGFEEGCRLLKHFGFELSGKEKNYLLYKRSFEWTQ